MENLFWGAGAALLFLGSLTALLAPVRRVQRLPPWLAYTVALALLVCLETLLLNALATFQGVTRTNVVAGHALLIAVCLMPAPARAWAGICDQLTQAFRLLRRRPFMLVLLPLVILVILSAVRYAPNNFDAMTYHLARVAHWMQNRSVGPYSTGIYRQLVLPAGSDYLLLALQLVSQSDRLANFLQLGCYLLVVLSAPSLARLAGASTRVGGFAALLVAALPMAVLQASSAQNDLVASVVCVAIVATSIPFLHVRRRVFRLRARALLFAAVICAGALVKPTALLAAGPFFVIAVLATIVRLSRRVETIGEYGVPFLAAMLLVAAICGPELQRRNVFRDAPEAASGFSYPVFGEWGHRAANSLRGLAHHLPPPRSLAAVLTPPAAKECSATSAFCVTTQFRAHEDLAGNPAQAAIMIVAIGLATVRGRTVPRRGRVAVAALVGSWILFHAFLRDNFWIQRLELPLFALCPLSMAAFTFPGRQKSRQRWADSIGAAVALLLLGNACRVAVGNELRPPLGPKVPRDWSYYNSFATQLVPQDTTLKYLSARRCLRLGLYMNETGYDYPLTWRAMQTGAVVRHVAGPDPWPCLLYSDRGEPPEARAAGWEPLAWTDGADGRPLVFLYMRPAAR